MLEAHAKLKAGIERLGHLQEKVVMLHLDTMARQELADVKMHEMDERVTKAEATVKKQCEKAAVMLSGARAALEALDLARRFSSGLCKL